MIDRIVTHDSRRSTMLSTVSTIHSMFCEGSDNRSQVRSVSANRSAPIRCRGSSASRIAFLAIPLKLDRRITLETSGRPSYPPSADLSFANHMDVGAASACGVFDYAQGKLPICWPASSRSKINWFR
jgi:hypothetical protein